MTKSRIRNSEDHNPVYVDQTLCTREFPKNDRQFVRALGRGFEILEAFQRQSGPLSIGDIAELTGLTKPTISRLTHTLRELGYLRQSKDRRYNLTPRVVSLGFQYLAEQRVRKHARGPLMEFAQQGHLTLGVVVPDGHSMVYVDEYSTNKVTGLRFDIGARLEMAKSATGYAYLAGLDETRRNALLLKLKYHHGSNWEHVEERLERTIFEIEQRGFGYEDGEWRSDTRAVVAPLVSRDKQTVFVINCGAPTFASTSEEFLTKHGPRLAQVVEMLSDVL